jgi:SP family myo-inositol transporter-like MFS transporter 13
MITAGQVVAYLVGWGFSGLNGGWRWMVGIGAVPAVVQVILLVFMPESPRWAVRAGQVEKARTVLGKVYGGSEGLVRVVMRRMEREVWEEDGDEGLRNVPESGKPGWRAHLARTGDRFALLHVPGNRRALMIACFLQGFQQLSGFVSLLVSILPAQCLGSPLGAHILFISSILILLWTED